MLCRLWQEHVQNIAYRRWAGCWRGRVSLAGQPPHQKLRPRLWSVHHQSTLAGHCCSLRAGWRQDKVALGFINAVSSLCWTRGIKTNVQREKDILKMSRLGCLFDKTKDALHVLMLVEAAAHFLTSLMKLRLRFDNKHGVYHQILTGWDMGSLSRSSHAAEHWEYRREEEPEEDHPPSKLQPLQFWQWHRLDGVGQSPYVLWLHQAYLFAGSPTRLSNG